MLGKIFNGIVEIKPLLSEDSARGHLVRLALFFLIYMLTGMFSWTFSYFSDDPNDILHRFLASIISKATIVVLDPFFKGLSFTQNYVLTYFEKPLLVLNPGCNGFEPATRIILTLLIYPLKWQRKPIIALFTLLILMIGTIVHFVILTIVVLIRPDSFQFFHDYVSRYIFYLFYFSCWLFWEFFRKPWTAGNSETRASLLGGGDEGQSE